MQNHNAEYLSQVATYLETRGIHNLKELEGILEPNYYVIIPIDILERTDISANTKIVYGEITALSRKSGKCYATNKYLSNILGMAERTITRAVTDLAKLGLITVNITKTAKGTYRDIYITYNKPTRQNGERGQTKRRGGVDKMATQIRNREIEIDKPSAPNGDAVQEVEENSLGKIVNNIIALFEVVNPSYKRLYANKTQRAALERMLEQHGVEKISAIIQYLKKSNANKYAPTITTPAQLEIKLGDLLAWAEKQKQNVKAKAILI